MKTKIQLWMIGIWMARFNFEWSEFENQDSTLNDRNLNGSNDMDDATPRLIDKNNANQFLKFFF